MIDRTLNYGHHCIEGFLKGVDTFQTVLDIGAGHGADLLAARRFNPNAKLIGVEVYEPNILELRALGIETHQLDMEHDVLPFKDESIDIVICNQFLEHTKEIFWIFHEITRVLKIGGRLIIGVPNLASFHNRILLLFGVQPTQIKSSSAHVRGFTYSDLKRFISVCWPDGYSFEKVQGSNFYPLPRRPSLLLARAFPNMAWGIFLMVRKRKSYRSQFVEFPTRTRLETNFYVGPKAR